MPPEELPELEGTDGGSGSGSVQTCHTILASADAGQPECWVAHLAKGGVMRALGARSGLHGGGSVRAATSCWMLVLTTTRHAVWIDYHDDEGEAGMEEAEIDV